MSKEPTLYTQRLILRPLTPADAPAMFSWTGDERVTRYTSYSTHRDLGQTEAWIRAAVEDPDKWTWGFALREDRRLIGVGSMKPAADAPGFWEIGYALHHDFWNRGYCTEAVRALLDYARFFLGVRKVCAVFAVDNPSSGRVLKKCGMRFAGSTKFTKSDGSQTFHARRYVLEWPLKPDLVRAPLQDSDDPADRDGPTYDWEAQYRELTKDLKEPEPDPPIPFAEAARLLGHQTDDDDGDR